jgi:hypothetical protein
MSIIVDNNNFNKFNEIESKQTSDSLINESPNTSRRKSVHINDIVSIIDIENQKKYTRRNSLNISEIQRNTRLLEKYRIDYNEFDEEEKKDSKCFGCKIF